jgi:hypothetical protein
MKMTDGSKIAILRMVVDGAFLAGRNVRIGRDPALPYMDTTVNLRGPIEDLLGLLLAREPSQEEVESAFRCARL